MSPSELFDQDTFYPKLLEDLAKARRLVLIESPFMTIRRVRQLATVLQKLHRHGVRIVINTKPIDEHDVIMAAQALESVALLQSVGVIVLYTIGHHRKLAIIDRQTVWEGSLNILSQNDSCEIMRRTYSDEYAEQLLAFLGLDKFII